MAGTQTDNLLLLDLTSGLSRTPETGGTPDLIATSNDWEWVSGANVVIDGNLTVNGTTVTIHSEQVNIRDNHLYLNADYTTTAAQTGGLVINVLPTATTDTVAATGFVAGVPATSNPVVTTVGSATFSADDIVQFSGANNQDNDGLYEVLSHVGTALTVKGIGNTATTEDWFQNQFTTDTTVAGAITVVNVAVLRGDSSGNWESTLDNSTTALTYNTFTTQGVVSLQVAYVAGDTITTSGGEGDVTIAGTETLVITTSGGVDLDAPFDFDSTAFDVQMTGTNGFSIDGTAASNVSATDGNLDLTTVTSGDVNISSAAELDLDAVTTMVLNTADAADASGNDVTVTAASSTAGTAGGASIILTPGDGFTTGVAGSVDVTGPNDEDEALFTLESTGTNGDKIGMYVGASDPDASITALAGSLFFRDTGSGAELYLNTSTGSGTTWTAFSSAAGATLQSAYEAGNTITTAVADGDLTINGTEDFLVGGSVDVSFDTTGSISFDANVASNFTVDSADLTLSTTSSGTLAVTSAGVLDLDGASVTIDAGTTAVLNTTDAADASGNDITLTAASSTAGTAGGASIILTPGDGDTTGTAGLIDITGPNDEDEAILQLTTGGTNGDSIQMFVGDSDPDAAVTGSAGSLFFRDTSTTGELYLNTSTGSGTSWEQVVTAAGGLTLQSAYVGGNTITTSGGEGDFDVSGTEAISLDAGGTSNFSVAGADLTLETTGSGTVDINSAADIDVTFAAANSAAMVIDDGANTYMTFDSTAAEPAVEIEQFLDIVGSGAGVTLTAGEAIAVAQVVTIEATSGDAILADSDTGTTLDGLAIGVAAFASADASPVKVYTVAGSLIPISFSGAPAASSNGSSVFVSATPGVATLTAPTASGNVVYLLGILQGADGGDTTPLVLFQPQLIAVRT